MPRPNAPLPAVPSTAPSGEVDHRFARVPTVRHAMNLIVPQSGGKTATISVTENKNGGRIGIDVGGVERDLTMNVRELRALADICNRIARRVASRPEWKP